MIYSLTGELTYIGDQFLVIDCGGVGFKCFSSLSTASTAGRIGEQVRLFTYLSVKEDALDLYGFKTDNPLMLSPIVAALFRKVNPQSKKERL